VPGKDSPTRITHVAEVATTDGSQTPCASTGERSVPPESWCDRSLLIRVCAWLGRGPALDITPCYEIFAFAGLISGEKQSNRECPAPKLTCP
jgi:hypothetical protein